MNGQLVENFNTQTFNQGSAILKIRYYTPKNLIVQHLPVKERGKKFEINRLRNDYIIDAFTSIDAHEIIKIGGKVIEIYEGVNYREIVKVFDKLSALGQNYKDENNEIMQLLVKLLWNSL